jgi:HD-GYP domain-containing protein (c-di-GMP phosphodiesterase class II)
VAEKWEPVDIADLRVGHFVHIDHSWLEHPFLRRSFLIETPRELALIRGAGLTRLSIDRARSTPTPMEEGASPDDEGVAADAARLQTEKAAYTTVVHRRRAELVQTQRQYEAAAETAQGLLGQLSTADRSACGTVEELVRQTIGGTPAGSPLTFAPARSIDSPERRLGCQALDAMAIAVAVGRRFGIQGDELELLATSALVHGAGLLALPENLRDEHAFSNEMAQLEFQDYPLLGVQLLRECGSFAPEVLQIVRQHRERPDGTGFPEGASADQIHRLAPIVGVVREFQVLSASRAAGVPAAALAHLYRSLRGAYGADVVDNLIAAVTVYPPGSYLALSDGSIARVMRVSEQARLRPTVCVFDAALTPADAEIVDLAVNSDVSVAKVLAPNQLDDTTLRFFGEGWSGYALGAAAPVA